MDKRDCNFTAKITIKRKNIVVETTQKLTTMQDDAEGSNTESSIANIFLGHLYQYIICICIYMT